MKSHPSALISFVPLMSLCILPNDLWQSYIIPKYFLGSITTEGNLDKAALPAMLMVLQLVNKQFNTWVRKCSLAWRAVQNFRNQATKCSDDAISLMLRRACREFGSISLLEWLRKYLHYPILQRSCYMGAARGTVCRFAKILC